MLHGVTVNTQTRNGLPVASILNEIHIGGYELVVLTARQGRQLKAYWGKNIARQIAKHAPNSVLKVKREWPNLQRILICTSGQKCAEPVVEMGAQNCSRRFKDNAQAYWLVVRQCYPTNCRLSPVPNPYCSKLICLLRKKEMIQYNENKTKACPHCGSDGILEEVQRHTYSAPITKQQINTRITYCPVCRGLDGTAKIVYPQKECEEDV